MTDKVNSLISKYVAGPTITDQSHQTNGSSNGAGSGSKSKSSPQSKGSKGSNRSKGSKSSPQSKSNSKKVRFRMSSLRKQKSHRRSVNAPIAETKQMAEMISNLWFSVATASSGETVMMERLWHRHGTSFVSRSMRSLENSQSKLEPNLYGHSTQNGSDLLEVERSIAISFEQTVSTTLRLIDGESYGL